MSLFNELLKVSLGTRDQLSRVPASNEWNSILNEARNQSVAAVMSCGVERLPAEQRPAESLFQRWLESRHNTAVAYSHYCRRAKEITGRLLDAGFKCCVLKGVAVSQFYPDPSLRKSGDVDLWVSGSRKEVMEWMESEGWVKRILWHKVVNFNLPPDLHADVSFHPTWLYNPCHNRRLQRFFDRNMASQMEIDGALGFACPSAMFNAVYALADTFRHFVAEGSGLRHVVDYYFILKALQADERKEAMKQIKRIGLSKFAGAMMWVLKEACGAPEEILLCQPDKKEGKFYMEEVFKAGRRHSGHGSGRRRKSKSRARMMSRHYFSEVIWMRPRKTWHKWWRFFNR